MSNSDSCYAETGFFPPIESGVRMTSLFFAGRTASLGLTPGELSLELLKKNGVFRSTVTMGLSPNDKNHQNFTPRPCGGVKILAKFIVTPRLRFAPLGEY